jgi:hypothetical protein
MVTNVQNRKLRGKWDVSLNNTGADDRILAANDSQLAAATIFLIDKQFFFKGEGKTSMVSVISNERCEYQRSVIATGNFHFHHES